ncbi:MAG: glycosyltransferase family 2 protein [Caldilineaceae bacterium]
MNTSAPVVSIVTANYNGAEHLPALLSCLQGQTLQEFELIVVDNRSTDSSLSILSDLGQHSAFPLLVIRNLRNLGFGPATNQGIRRSAAPWIATLNNDTRPESTWLEHLIDIAHGSGSLGSGIGMVGSKMLRAKDPTLIDSTGIAVDWSGIAWDLRGGERDDSNEVTPKPIFGPCAGAALYSRAMLEEIGMFDEDFFAYLEDVDIAWRARLAGWEAVLEPSSRVLHAHSATLGDASPRKRFLLARNKIWLLVKNYPGLDLDRYLAFILAYDAMAAAYGVATRADFAALRGRAAAMRMLPKFLTKRREIQERWQDVANWRKVVSPLVPPWSVSRRYAHLST